MAGNTRRATPASSPNNQQLYSKDATQTRRLRHRHSHSHSHSAKHESSKTPPDSCLQHGPKLTKTGRVSKARKGVRDAHTCRQCGKKYSRAEHLRRHEQNHEPSKLACPWPDCAKTFSRQDLLDRHEIKHRISNDCTTSSGSESGSEQNPNIAIITPNLATPATCDTEQPGVAMAEQNATQEEGTAPALSHGAFSIKRTILPSEQSTEIPLVSWIDEASLAASEPDAIEFPDRTILSSGALPLHLSTSSTPNLFGPLISFSALSSDPWSAMLDGISQPTSIAPGIWMEPHPGPAGATFPPSFISSPSLHAIPRTIDSIPYPLPWSGHRDGYGSLDIERALDQQQLGEALNLKTKQHHYIRAYWKHFHPLFPVLHRKMYEQHPTNPLLSAAVMAIGAQYTNEPFARNDSQVLHQKCQELIAQCKDFLKTTAHLDHLQAVFLVELLSHFKAKRAPSSLSEVFRAIYDQLWNRHNILHPQSVSRSELDRLGAVIPQTDEDTINQQWFQWIIANSFERLLVACYILESYEGLLLIRPAADIHRTAVGIGLELYMPVNIAIWDTQSATQWRKMLAKAADRDIICRTKDVLQTLDDIAKGVQAVRLDPFQSSLLIAIQASAIFYQTHGASPYTTFTHTIFAVEKSTLFSTSLSRNAHVRLMHEAVLLSASSPFKALLAVSGESWLLSSRLSHEARTAKETFELLKLELRQWTQGLQFLYPGEPISFTNATALSAERHVPANRALRHALNILDLSLATSPALPGFGPEMALHYAALVLWAYTYAAHFAEGFRMDMEIPPRPQLEPPLELELELCCGGAATKQTKGKALENAARRFVDGAERLGGEMELGDAALMQIDGLRERKVGVMAVLGWAAWVVGGGETSGSGVGELMNGVSGVLEKLGKKGWDEGWF